MTKAGPSIRRQWLVFLCIVAVCILPTECARKRRDESKERFRNQVDRAQVLNASNYQVIILRNTTTNTTNTVPLTNSTTTNNPTLNSTSNTESTATPASNANSSNQSSGLNVVLFYVDDWAADVLGLVNDLVHTPHLDALAAEGQWFPHSYVTSSVCWQSRATLLTGKYVAVHKFFQLSSTTALFEPTKWNQTLFHQLRNVGGYHVGFVGKWHASQPPGLIWEAFDVFRPYMGAHWLQRDNETRHITELNQADALEFLRDRPPDKKFALAVSFYATHSWNRRNYPEIYSPQNYTQNLYAPSVSIPRPVTATQEAWEKLPYFFNESSQGRFNWHKRGFDTEETRQVTTKNIFRMAKEVDDAIGKVIQELQDQGVYNNTLLVFTADNGSYMGEHGLAGKWHTHDQSIRVPLIIRDPRMVPNSRNNILLPNPNVALNIDLAPTILAAANITPPEAMQGRDLAAGYLLDHPESDQPFRTDFFYEWNRGSTLDGLEHPTSIYYNPSVFALIQRGRACNCKYIYWPQVGMEQIFNLTEDPTEQNDILQQVQRDRPTQYEELKRRYDYLKIISQRGDKIW